MAGRAAVLPICRNQRQASLHLLPSLCLLSFGELGEFPAPPRDDFEGSPIPFSSPTPLQALKGTMIRLQSIFPEFSLHSMERADRIN